MPPQGPSGLQSDDSIVQAEQHAYSAQVVGFIHRGLAYTVQKIHGPEDADRDKIRHVSGQQLCQGLREYALQQWGFMAASVLRKWNVHATLDFGKIVFALVELKLLSTMPNDTLDDFKNVYDFHTAFETDYRIKGGK